MERKDAQSAANGSIEEKLKEELIAQYAVIDSAIKLINQQAKNTKNEQEKETETTGWVYNMDELKDWLHYYTERRKLHCPKCQQEKTYFCTTCGNEAEYHDEL